MNENVVLTRDVSEQSEPGAVRLRWGGLFGGIAVAVGTWVLLTTLGLAVGLSSFNPNDTMSAVKSFGIGAGIWTIVVSMISLFVGGLVGARASGIRDRPSGAIHGAVLWSLATVLSIALVGNVVRGVAGGVVNTAGMAASAAAQGAGNVGGALGIDSNDLVAPLNERLRAEGKPTIAPAQLQGVLQAATSKAIREGRLDKQTLITSVTESTSLSQADATDIANRVEAQVGPKVNAAAEDVKSGALQAADAAGKGLWGVFFAMLLGLGASVLGSTLGVDRHHRRTNRRELRPYATTREAHS